MGKVFIKSEAHLITEGDFKRKNHVSGFGTYKNACISGIKKVRFGMLQDYQNFPQEEKFTMVQQIRRPALSVHLNIAEGCSRKSETERKRFFEISRGSVIEIDTALDIAHELEYKTQEELKQLGIYLVSTFKQLTGLIAQSRKISDNTNSLLIIDY